MMNGNYTNEAPEETRCPRRGRGGGYMLLGLGITTLLTFLFLVSQSSHEEIVDGKVFKLFLQMGPIIAFSMLAGWLRLRASSKR